MRARFVRHDDGSASLVGTAPRDLDRMRRFFSMIHRRSGHYRAVMEGSGLAPEDDPVSTLGRFPATTREDYRDALQPEALARQDAGRFTCDYSSGSTGRCVLRVATPADELAEQAVTERVFRRAGLTGGDTFVCADIGFPEIYDFYFRAARALGARRTLYLQLTKDYGRSLRPLGALAPDVFLTLPSLLVRSWPHLSAIWPRGRSPIRSLIFMGEPMHPGFREEVAETLGCRVYSFYGTTETGGVAGECGRGDGCHFDPSQLGATLLGPTFLDDRTAQGELLQTTWHLRDHPVVKYQVGDLVRITSHPCPCGEPTPRLRVVERTHESFVLAGMKLRYRTVLDALAGAVGDLGLMAITLEDLPESDGHTLMRVALPARLRAYESDLLDVLRHGIFELDDLHQFGLVRFRLEFLADDRTGRRKLRRVTDLRRYMGEDRPASGDEPPTGPMGGTHK